TIARPRLIRPLRAQPLSRDRRVAKPAALALALGHPQPLLAPQPLHPLAVHLPPLLPQVMVRTAVSQRGRSLEKLRSSARNAASSAARTGSRRCVERCCPTTRHAQRSLTPRRSQSIATAWRRRAGPTSF